MRRLQTDGGVEIAWSRATGEIWYVSSGFAYSVILAITPEGRERLVATLARGLHAL